MSLFRVSGIPVGGQGIGESEQPKDLSPRPNEGQQDDRPTTTVSVPMKIDVGLRRGSLGCPPISGANAMLQTPSFAKTEARENRAGPIFRSRRAQETIKGSEIQQNA